MAKNQSTPRTLKRSHDADAALRAGRQDPLFEITYSFGRPMKLTNPLRHPFRVGRVEKPCEEGRFNLPNGRRLSFAEYGDPSGAVVLWQLGAPESCGALTRSPTASRASLTAVL